MQTDNKYQAPSPLARARAVALAMALGLGLGLGSGLGLPSVVLGQLAIASASQLAAGGPGQLGGIALTVRVGTNTLSRAALVSRAVGIEDDASSESSGFPTVFELGTNYPNPFAGATTIPYALPEASHVRMDVLDQLGRSVVVLNDSRVAAGRHQVTYHADALPAGLYFIRIRAGEFSTVRPITVMR